MHLSTLLIPLGSFMAVAVAIPTGVDSNAIAARADAVTEGADRAIPWDNAGMPVYHGGFWGGPGATDKRSESEVEGADRAVPWQNADCEGYGPGPWSGGGGDCDWNVKAREESEADRAIPWDNAGMPVYHGGFWGGPGATDKPDVEVDALQWPILGSMTCSMSLSFSECWGRWGQTCQMLGYLPPGEDQWVCDRERCTCTSN